MATAIWAATAARRRRTEALAEHLYATHRARLLAIARVNSASFDDAEDALQDAFILFIDHFDPDCESPPIAWLTLTLKRRCWALYGRQALARQAIRGQGERLAANLGHRIASRGPDEIVEAATQTRAAGDGLTELKPDERQALSLLSFGHSYREICELTGWTYTKVNRCIHEGRAALRQAVAANPTRLR